MVVVKERGKILSIATWFCVKDVKKKRVIEIWKKEREKQKNNN